MVSAYFTVKFSLISVFVFRSLTSNMYLPSGTALYSFGFP